MKGIIKILCIGLSVFIGACNYWSTSATEEGIARVGEVYLKKEDVVVGLPKNISPEDSLLWIKQRINEWATQQILLNKAKFNLSKPQQDEFERLTNSYRLDLYTNSYMNLLLSKQLDTVVQNQELVLLHEKMSKSFVLNEDLLQYRYLQLGLDYKNKERIIEMFQTFNEEDKEELDSLSIQFHSFRLNDSVWVKQNELIKEMPIMESIDIDDMLKKSNFLSVEDSLGLYLVQIKRLLKRGEQAPLEYVTPTLRQIILNKRKLELIKQLEKEIRKDAQQNNEFEIFN